MYDRNANVINPNKNIKPKYKNLMNRFKDKYLEEDKKLRRAQQYTMEVTYTNRRQIIIGNVREEVE